MQGHLKDGESKSLETVREGIWIYYCFFKFISKHTISIETIQKSMNFQASNTVADSQKARINSKESSIQSVAAKPPEEQSSNWDSKTYGVPMWKRGELDLELD